MKGMIDKIDEVLKKLRLETYYDIPRFHTSIAWSILNPSPLSVEKNEIEDSAKRRKVEKEEEETFSVEELKMLEEKFGKKLRAEEIWVECVCLKIGKDVIRFKLKYCTAFIEGSRKVSSQVVALNERSMSKSILRLLQSI